MVLLTRVGQVQALFITLSLNVRISAKWSESRSKFSSISIKLDDTFLVIKKSNVSEVFFGFVDQ